ncbi:E3 SUMO-protein ligase ZBED1-like [Cyprinodon tularosa]|uniref:E3 SUMO-protein ligase ZBED1-like n=1 Tax=Cyprinodon tularosa TaxID=77115 RepID=UPI0018E24B7F|nr:E3 SUMO-protein ligase ZBED1-like [Cyprinodon tularosa]XP_038134827.1 E3 SUMO-protein ligase ZBED1-like [Cyprinodon tularosa]XP_038149797.1 E3 SUMO-protein ligase ZBED1-like [Cyprinodon tularosa]XP_038152166.1 E3 SUMO-protein ligase ZBED1-like [Cyprinodon tularosa]XP_038157129.1 E3 SUMO-protein ligase ZBED1-like [Cyprinodon tularosa]
MAEAGADAEPTKLIPKKNSTSVIWQYFGFEATDEHQKQVICQTCRGKVATSAGNTTNLHRHLRVHHLNLYEDCMAKKSLETSSSSDTSAKQPTITSSFASLTPYERTSRRHKEITTAVTNYISKDMVSVNTVTKDAFKSLLRTMDKRYVLPSRTYFNRVAIPQLYGECRAKVLNELENMEFYASTTDLWSSRTTEPYMSLTVHFVNANFELRSRCLQTAYFPTDHTGENIATGLKECLANWGLKEEAQTCITTDNATNMVKAMELNQWTRLQCFGHRLHLAIENAVKDDQRIKRATGLCKQLVAVFSHSWKKKAALKQAQEDLNLPQQSMVTECPTRWGSRQKMIERVLGQSKALCQVLSEDRKTRHLVPTWQDTDVLESVNNALGPLQEFTDALSGEDYVSVSYLKPVLHLLRTATLAVTDQDTDLTKEIKSKALHYIEEKYSDPATQELLDIASFLDPRFKTNYISEENVQFMKDRVKMEMEQLALKEQRACVKTHPMPLSTEEEPPSTSTKRKRSLGSFFKAVPASSTMQLEDTIKAELDNYLITPSIDGEQDPLAWWRVHNVNFPWLSRLARKYLCIPATSAPSERLFSASGNIVTCQRASLKPARVDMLVFLAKNL